MADVFTMRLRDMAHQVRTELNALDRRIDALASPLSEAQIEAAMGFDLKQIHIGTTPPTSTTAIWIDTN